MVKNPSILVRLDVILPRDSPRSLIHRSGRTLAIVVIFQRLLVCESLTSAANLISDDRKVIAHKATKTQTNHA